VSETSARLLVLAAAVLFSTGGAVIKSTTLTAWQVAGLRSAIAALALLTVLPSARRRWHWHHLLVGTAYASTLVLFVSATKLTTAANAIYLQATAPLYLLVLAPRTLNERIRVPDVVFLGLMATGLIAFFLGETQPGRSAPNPWAGNILGAISGFTWAVTVTGLRWVSRRGHEHTLATVVIGNVMAAAICLPRTLPLRHVSAMDWLALTWLGVFQIALAYVCLSRGVRHITALEVSLLLLAEPVLNPVWAWLAHGERLSAWGLAGAALIIAATVGRTFSGAARQRPVASTTPRC
jgi:drug/metabolite transporter (DMT)-like permease